jgi:AmiR/NasT family two-component response regulator
MSGRLRVVVADDEPELRAFYEAILVSLGHEVVAVAADGQQLVQLCRSMFPDLVMSDIKMPGKDGIEAVLEAFRENPLRVILVTGFHAPSHIHSALGEMVLAYLAKPFQRRDLESAIERAGQRFDEFQALRENGSDPQRAVENREILRLAKGILMTRDGLGDRAAFGHLQQLARDAQVTLAEMARRVIASQSAPPSVPDAAPRDPQASNCL